MELKCLADDAGTDILVFQREKEETAMVCLCVRACVRVSACVCAPLGACACV